jgi:periplasmic divalent cation tolerance protein
MNSDAVVILSTAPSDEVATKVARALVEGGLVACVNIVPGVRSIYRWQGKVCEDAERLLIIKTRPARVDAVIAAIQQHHTYECPEAIALPIVGGSARYLSWVAEMTA